MHYNVGVPCSKWRSKKTFRVMTQVLESERPIRNSLARGNPIEMSLIPPQSLDVNGGRCGTEDSIHVSSARVTFAEEHSSEGYLKKTLATHKIK